MNEELVETYKLHADLAERAATLREDFTKLYTGTVSAIVAAGILIHRLPAERPGCPEANRLPFPHSGWSGVIQRVRCQRSRHYSRCQRLSLYSRCRLVGGVRHLGLPDS